LIVDANKQQLSSVLLEMGKNGLSETADLRI